jgi:hypothetical protein
MNHIEQKELLATRAAVGRMPLARYFIEQGFSYNDAMTALKVAPRAKGMKALYAEGKAAAQRLLGKFN